MAVRADANDPTDPNHPEIIEGPAIDGRGYRVTRIRRADGSVFRVSVPPWAQEVRQPKSTTHCINGHEWTPENTYSPPRKPGKRQDRWCRPCRRDREAGVMHPVEPWLTEEDPDRAAVAVELLLADVFAA